MSDQTHCLARRTLYESRRALSPGPLAGHRYDLRALIGEADLPDHVELVWHGVNDRTNLRHFLASPVRWGECDVRRDPDGRLALRHDAFEGTVERRAGRWAGTSSWRSWVAVACPATTCGSTGASTCWARLASAAYGRHGRRQPCSARSTPWRHRYHLDPAPAAADVA